MRKLSGALTMGLIIAVTTGLVVTYAFAADDMGGANNAPAEIQSAPAGTSNAGTSNGATPGANGSSANPNNADSPANTPDNAANNGNTNDSDKSGAANNANATQPNSDQTGQATTPTDNNQSAQAQQADKKTHHSMAMSRHHVQVVQAALANSGQDVSVDGVWGPKTVRALKDFQKAHGLKATGQLDHATRQVLPLPKSI